MTRPFVVRIDVFETKIPSPPTHRKKVVACNKQHEQRSTHTSYVEQHTTQRCWCSLWDSGHEVEEGHEVATQGQLEQASNWRAQAVALEPHSRHHVLPGYHLPRGNANNGG